MNEGPAGSGSDCESPVSPGRTPLGVDAVDSFLGGGLPQGIMVDVVGGHGTGKTQMLLHTAAAFASAGKNVLYVDTTGKFRPERIADMTSPADPYVILDRITFLRAWNVSEQAAAGETMSTFDLVAVSSITDLFSYEYKDRRERSRMFFGYMRGLAQTAVRAGTTVIFSNTIHTMGNHEVENMTEEVDPFVHVRLWLSRVDVYSGKRLYGHISDALGGLASGRSGEGQFSYEITGSGFRSVC